MVSELPHRGPDVHPTVWTRTSIATACPHKRLLTVPRGVPAAGPRNAASDWAITPRGRPPANRTHRPARAGSHSCSRA
jgi:hypothetical protein